MLIPSGSKSFLLSWWGGWGVGNTMFKNCPPSPSSLISEYAPDILTGFLCMFCKFFKPLKMISKNNASKIFVSISFPEIRVSRIFPEIPVLRTFPKSVFQELSPKYRFQYPFLGADFKNTQTTKQLNKLIWTNRKVESKLYLLPIGPNRFV